MKPTQAVEIAGALAREAGAILMETFEQKTKVISSAGKDIKTAADLAAERLIIERIRPTGIPILSEEAGASGDIDPKGMMWIIDPLDGTLNYTRHLPQCCVSIALWDNGKPVAGAIHDFTRDRLYRGAMGTAAECNGSPIRVSDCQSIRQAVLATGFPTGRSYKSDDLGRFISQIQQFKKIRMIGSAALSLAHVAEGSYDAYQEEDIWLWDVAAGLAILQAAGGSFEITEPRHDWKLRVVAQNGLLSLSPPPHEHLEKY